jgi:DNA polymerase-3 subunit alpha
MLGMTSLAITDRSYMYGAVEFYNECMKNDIKPIIGVEFYTVQDIHSMSRNEKCGQIVLLAKNYVGYKNLIELSSIATTEGKYYNKPRIDMSLLQQYHVGLVCLSGCVQGEIPQLLLNENYDGAKRIAMQYKEIFGDDFYIELQNHGLKDELTVLPKLTMLADRLGIETVATNDVHYTSRADAYAQRLLTCIGEKKNISDPSATGYGLPDEWYLKSEQEMYSSFAGISPKALENTSVIEDKCTLTIHKDGHLPAFTNYPASFTSSEEYFDALCHCGFKKRYGSHYSDYIDRLEHEIQTIKKTGFVDYFLIVADIICYAKKNGIAVGPGRGSAVGSIVAYSIGITDIDPMRYNLIFERFLNPYRVTMPDIDIDIEVPAGRDELISYVSKRYGANNTMHIVTFNTLAARAAIREVGTITEASEDLIKQVLKLVPQTSGTTISQLLHTNKDLENLYKNNGAARKLLDDAMQVEGKKRYVGTHASGIVIIPSSEHDILPVMTSDKGQMSQYELKAVEQLGFLKIDFLGLKSLNVLKSAVRAVHDVDKDFNINKIPTDDQNVYDMLSEGKSSNIFQLDSDGMKTVLRDMKPSCFEDLIAVIALYRPGPMDSIPSFIRCKHDPTQISYKHPLLESILKETYGHIIYQEQVIQIVRTLAGYSYSDADLIRRSIAKKNISEMTAERETFIYGRVADDGTVAIPGCIRNGVPEEVAIGLWDDISKFASYAFNKSHATAYALVAYQLAYLKVHYPLQFEASIMTESADTPVKLRSVFNDCDKQNIKILPPSINKSNVDFIVEGNAIRYGLIAVKNVGKAALDELQMERAYGEYTSLQNVVERCQIASQEKILKALICAGAMDEFNKPRSQMLAILPELIKHVAKEKKHSLKEQVSIDESFFANPAEKNQEKTSQATITQFPYPDIPEFERSELLKMELDATGMYISGHPMDSFADKVKGRITHKLYQLSSSGSDGNDEKISIGDPIRVAGIILSVKKITTKKNTQMCFLIIEDQTGKADVTVFPRVFDSTGAHLTPGTPVLVFGKAERYESGMKVIANNIEVLAQTTPNA